MLTKNNFGKNQLRKHENISYTRTDDQYELYFNGIKIGSGYQWRQVNTHKLLFQYGENILAIKSTKINTNASMAAYMKKIKKMLNCRITLFND